MHLISIRSLRIDANQFPDVKKQVEDWYATVKKAEWNNLEDVRLIYRDAEAVGNFTVFNIKGNAYRLIVGRDYENQVIYYKYFITHAQYDKDKWKSEPLLLIEILTAIFLQKLFLLQLRQKRSTIAF